MMRGIFATKQATTIKLLFRKRFYLSFRYQLFETRLVFRPWHFLALLEVIKDIFRGGKLRLVDLRHTAQFPGKIFQIISLGKTCQLGNVIQAHINEPFCARVLQPIKEVVRSRLGEPNCKNLNHHSTLDHTAKHSIVSNI